MSQIKSHDILCARFKTAQLENYKSGTGNNYRSQMYNNFMPLQDSDQFECINKQIFYFCLKKNTSTKKSNK